MLGLVLVLGVGDGVTDKRRSILGLGKTSGFWLLGTVNLVIIQNKRRQSIMGYYRRSFMTLLVCLGDSLEKKSYTRTVS